MNIKRFLEAGHGNVDRLRVDSHTFCLLIFGKSTIPLYVHGVG